MSDVDKLLSEITFIARLSCHGKHGKVIREKLVAFEAKVRDEALREKSADKATVLTMRMLRTELDSTKAELAALRELMSCGHPRACWYEPPDPPSIYCADKPHCTACSLREPMACTHPKACWQATKPDSVDAVVGYRCVACEHEAHVADLKRQLRQALAQVEIVDRALGDPGNTSSKVALDAYVQEKVESERKMWQSRESEEYRQALLKRAVEAEKRAEKAESNMAKAVLAESEWWGRRVRTAHSNIEAREMEDRTIANRAKVKDADPPKGR